MLEYLKAHIIEELGGAVDYMMKAIQHKGTAFGPKFYKMSEAESEHAACLTRMFTQMEKPATVTDAEHAKMYKEIMDGYSSAMSKLETLKKLYTTQS